MSDAGTDDALGPGWEVVTADLYGVPTLRRIEVPGGWLYLMKEWGLDPGDAVSVALCFVPFPSPPIHWLAPQEKPAP